MRPQPRQSKHLSSPLTVRLWMQARRRALRMLRQMKPKPPQSWTARPQTPHKAPSPRLRSQPQHHLLKPQPRLRPRLPRQCGSLPRQALQARLLHQRPRLQFQHQKKPLLRPRLLQMPRLSRTLQLPSRIPPKARHRPIQLPSKSWLLRPPKNQALKNPQLRNSRPQHQAKARARPLSHLDRDLQPQACLRALPFHHPCRQQLPRRKTRMNPPTHPQNPQARQGSRHPRLRNLSLQPA